MKNPHLKRLDFFDKEEKVIHHVSKKIIFNDNA